MSITKPIRCCRDSLQQIITANIKTNVDGSVSSHATRKKYANSLHQSFRNLEALGFKLSDAKNLKGKHVVALGKYFEQQAITGKLKPSTIQGRFSVLRVFAHWIGKDGMVEATHKYVDLALVQRSSICSHDHSWPAQGVDVVAKLAEVSQKDERVGLQLRLELESGLRGKEAMMLRPYLADKGAYLDVSVGTKGGRPRAVLIKTAEQRALLDKAKTFAATKDSSTSDPNRSLAQWKNHYYYVLRRCGITRKNGLTAHGLRHTYAHNRYKELSGQDSPVRGGKLVNREDDRAARLQVAEELGHSRESITTHYLGRGDGKDKDK
ncbi:MAG: Fis family transcriptional regulator [Methyloglobulus sp.]|nr:Fis family transcriptional regulator [Methyloglobulus sp.]